MKNVAILKKTDPQIIELFNFVIGSNFHEFTTLPELRNAINRDYYKMIPTEGIDNYIKKLSAFNFYKRENYEILDGSKVYDLMNNLSNFRDELVIYIDMKNNKGGKEHVLERQISPGLEAYDFVGHSKLYIKPTGKDFGLLTE